MSPENRQKYVAAEAYLMDEERAQVRHEYVDGNLFAMTGGTRRHNIISSNIFSAVRSHLKGSRCKAYINDVKVRIEATNSFYYPDVMVSCDQSSMASVVVDCPVFIAEVVSRSTASIDRREKLYAYRQLPSLREYMIVHQMRKQVELHRKNKDGAWEILNHGPATEIMIESLPTGPLRMSIDDIYEEAELGPDRPFQVREGAQDEWAYESWPDSESEEEEELDW